MTERLTQSDLKRLAKFEGGSCLSLFLPTHRSLPETRQDRIRFKNMLKTATEKLLDSGLRRPDAERVLQPAVDRARDDAFWAHQSDGLAVFLADGHSAEFRLPLPFTERVSVAPAFHLTPLLPLAHGNGRFHVLAISQKSCRLFRADRDEIQELQVEDLPHDLQSALGWWRERELNFRSHATGAGNETAMFHGHEEDDKRIDLTAYFRRVAKALHPVPELSRLPLVFAGVEALYPIFKNVSGELSLLDRAVTGNPDRLSPQELHSAAWKLVEPHYRSEIDRLLESFFKQEKKARGTRSLAAILPAARDGLVETLLVPAEAEQPGQFNGETGQVLLGDSEQATDVFNLAAVLTLRTDGQVIPTEASRLPDGLPVATLRAPVDAIAMPSLET